MANNRFQVCVLRLPAQFTLGKCCIGYQASGITYAAWAFLDFHATTFLCDNLLYSGNYLLHGVPQTVAQVIA